mmetsp:Transcript_12254/g.30975  ORF Transcript_12254/g.30975 Transcript_12254/m.30975 type:complete len:80 (+) Transcript_12254:77-316(+)
MFHCKKTERKKDSVRKLLVLGLRKTIHCPQRIQHSHRNAIAKDATPPFLIKRKSNPFKHQNRAYIPLSQIKRQNGHCYY